MKHIFICIFLGYTISGKSQLNDNNWLVYQTETKTSQVDFRTVPPTINISQKLPFIGIVASFSNGEGNLLYYTNGLKLYNKLDTLMENGDSINAGLVADIYENFGYPVFKGAFFLTKPDDSTKCYLFHMFLEFTPSYTLTKLLYTVIDKTANNGTGKVIEKNIPLLSGNAQLNFNHAVAVRHGNGRDWWIMIPHLMQPKYFRLLLTPEGIFGLEMQESGFKQPTNNPNNYRGTSLFSPDGTKYADYDFLTGIQVFDFDRCTGLLSNPVKIDYQWDPDWNNGESGIAFSPSGRFLYMTRKKGGPQVVQYDLQAADIAASEYVISSCSSNNNYECSVSHPLLAPDGKIYIGALIDTVAFHIIHQPDSIGLACEFDKGAFVFPQTYPWGVLPYFPNYRHYDLPGSPCDTLGIGPVAVQEEEKEKWPVKIWPNPASTEVHLSLLQAPGIPTAWRLYDAIGREVRRATLMPGQTEYSFSLKGIPDGLYFWLASSAEGHLSSGKLTILK